MSEDWSKPHDIDLLADGHASIAFAIPLVAFPRLAPQLARADGMASGQARFAREAGTPVAHVRVQAHLALTCQRCMAPYECAVDSDDTVAMVADGAGADAAPAGRETILAPERRLSVRELVEEELLLALPIVPLHEPGECVGGLAAETSAPQAAAHEERQRPFAQLAELLKRDRH